jgi:predicted nuclease with TOPRIM domain
MKWLQEIVGDNPELLEKIQEGMKENVVEKSEFDELQTKFETQTGELTGVQEQLQTATITIDEMSKVSGEGEDFKAKFDELKVKFDESTSGYETKIANMGKTSILEKSLIAAGANPEVVDLLMNDFDMDDIQLDEKDPKVIVGWEEKLSAAKEKRPSAYATVKVDAVVPQEKQTKSETNGDDKKPKFVNKGRR